MQLFIRLLNQRLGIITLQIIIFLSFLTIVKPSLSEVNCGRYPTVYGINPNGSRFKECLFSTKYNQHGVIYKIGLPNSEADIIYKGKDGDAILELPSFSRSPEPPTRKYGVWRQAGQEYLFQFPSGMKFYIPK